MVGKANEAEGGLALGYTTWLSETYRLGGYGLCIALLVLVFQIKDILANKFQGFLCLIPDTIILVINTQRAHATTKKLPIDL